VVTAGVPELANLIREPDRRFSASRWPPEGALPAWVQTMNILATAEVALDKAIRLLHPVHKAISRQLTAIHGCRCGTARWLDRTIPLPSVF